MHPLPQDLRAQWPLLCPAASQAVGHMGSFFKKKAAGAVSFLISKGLT